MRPLITGSLLLAVVVCSPGVSHAQGSGATVLNFTCDGTLTGPSISNEEKPEVLHNVGLVVNLAERTVSFSGYVAPFDKVDAARISFNGTSVQHGISTNVFGSIDRVTGVLEAIITTAPTSVSGSFIMHDWHWSMLCKPTSRLF